MHEWHMMKLTDAQLHQFHTEGWLFPPELFTPEEIEVLREESAKVLASDRREIRREKKRRAADRLCRPYLQ
jgi:ectoine hydroxylase